jgi:ribosomal protein S18 acetylase RimI-like enzyme
MREQFNVNPITATDPRLDWVKTLGRKHSDTLGFFPNGAYEEHAAKGHLLVAASQSGTLAGYCAFRISKGRAMIAHLCVAPDFERRGAATALCDAVKRIARERDLNGVGLHCRRDYPAYGAWSKFGFIPRGSKPGRGEDGADLTFWWFDLRPQGLFSDLPPNDEGLVAVMDFNVFRDLHDQTEDRNREAPYLLADWLTGQLELCVVDELFVEIDRLPLPRPRDQWVHDARRYRELAHPEGRAALIYGELKLLFGYPAPTPQQESDMKHVAKSAAAGASVLLTRDEELLGHSAEIEKRYGLQVMRPVDIISRLDEAERAASYQPVRFASTDVQRCRPKADDVDHLAAAFHLPEHREKRDQFAAKLRAFLSDVRGCEMEFAQADGSALFLVAAKHAAARMDLNLLRVGRGALAATTLRHALLQLIAKASKVDRGQIVVTEDLLSDDVQGILRDLTFRRTEGTWVKSTLRFLGDAPAVRALIDSTPSGLNQALEFEASYWPAKLLGQGIPTWIVPIQPGWAAQLFETNLSAGFLFPANRDLVLARENVYYSGALQSGMSGAGRIVWYVSGDADHPGSKCIRGCSRLLEVRRGMAADLYRDFRRIGIFERRDLLAKTKNDLTRDLLALRFANTELFEHPVDYETTRILGIRHNFTSPARVDDHTFEQIYRRGTGMLTA